MPSDIVIVPVPVKDTSLVVQSDNGGSADNKRVLNIYVHGGVLHVVVED